MNKTIGSVSALIALSAATASADIVASPFTNVDLDLESGFSLDLDMDNDGNNDFSLDYANAQGSIVGETGNGIFVIDLALFETKRFAYGTEISLSETGSDTAYWNNLIGQGVSYVGVKFQVGGQTNLGWIQFNLPDSSRGCLVQGAWENIPGNSILAGTGPKHDQMITNFPNPGDQLITNTVHLFAQASSGLPVSFTNLAGSPVNWQNATTITFTATGVVCIVALQAGDTNWNAAPDVTNTFNVTALPVQDGWLAVNVTPETGSWALSAPTGYTGPTSGTGNLAAVSAVTGQYDISYGALSGYVAPSNQTRFVTGGSTTLFAGVYLQISTNIGTPSGVSATEGTYTNRIRVTWQGVAGATGYEIWRSQTNDADTAGRIADIPIISVSSEQSAVSGEKSAKDHSSIIPSFQSSRSGQRRTTNEEQGTSTYTYDDYAINPILSYYYWVRAKTAALISPMSYVGMGYAMLDPSRASGTADIAVSDFIFLPVNMTNVSIPGTVSCWVQNYGPDNVSDSSVRFDFYLTNGVWSGYVEEALTLEAGTEQLLILALAGRRGISIRGDLSGTYRPAVIVRHLTPVHDPNMANNTASGAGQVTVKNAGVNSPGRSLNDYDGDGKSDAAVCATNMTAWGVLYSGTRYRDSVVVEPGETEWIAVPGDYEGAGKTGVGVYVPVVGLWYLWLPSAGQGVMFYFGGPDYTPVPADYDGDGKTDPAVYGESAGYWAGCQSAYNYQMGEAWVGGVGYLPVARDYDGDGKADPAAYRENTGIWMIRLSGTQYALAEGQFGGQGYQAVPADFDGDGLADPALYERNSGIWHILPSASGYPLTSGVFGGANYVPAIGDYDGDGLADPAVYDLSTGAWYGLMSSRHYAIAFAQFGSAGYRAVSE